MENAFFAVYGLLKWLAQVLSLEKYVNEYFKVFEEFIKIVQGTPLWPLVVSILTLVVMMFTAIGIFYGTWATVGTLIFRN